MPQVVKCHLTREQSIINYTLVAESFFRAADRTSVLQLKQNMNRKAIKMQVVAAAIAEART